MTYSYENFKTKTNSNHLVLRNEETKPKQNMGDPVKSLLLITSITKDKQGRKKLKTPSISHLGLIQPKNDSSYCSWVQKVW